MTQKMTPQNDTLKLLFNWRKTKMVTDGEEEVRGGVFYALIHPFLHRYANS